MIVGERVVMRSRRASDVAFARKWYLDPETTRWLLMPYPPADDAYEIPAEPSTFTDLRVTVDDRETGTPIGTAGLMIASPEHRRAMFFVVLGDAAFRGRGYGSDIIRTLCRFGFDSMNLEKVELEALVDNVAAVRAYEAAGFVPEVRRRRAHWVHGQWRDAYLMGLLREELR